MLATLFFLFFAGRGLDPSPRYGAIVPARVYGLLVGGRMPKIRDFPSMDADGQTETLWIDWGNDLSEGVTLDPNATPTVTVSVVYGSDPAPQSRLLTTPYVGTVSVADQGTGVQNAAVLFNFGNVIGGVTYLIEVTCLRTDGTVASAVGHIAGITPT